MIAMQYKIAFPDDYDMNLIRQRVEHNGAKTDGFQDLLFKAYLIADKSRSPKSANEYSPLYLWADSGGMNRFLFDGFYDNILNSFGWQKVQIGVPLNCELTPHFAESRFVAEIEHEIRPVGRMERMEFSPEPDGCTGKMLIYNPDKWRYAEYFFSANKPELPASPDASVYEVLHLSLPQSGAPYSV
ncbi:DUF4865 family protein [Saccharibacillus sp. CPCC 101409]|uniref:DUF4865 family protein n=1 Tax=Saccharibacillus sp. CPCC 101409 TaxID=3058041 RepID=UPI002673F149|nr:DUF4865 family protein [Saccharibacillus sp. CPCC 101409]MDO3411865.1 DUF4865 family protein [Saccharibacillus sp. CPCC 101409]